jgi:RNA polymerase sigma factor (sigma-70 family)
MTDASDMDLVRRFARDHSEAAFTELVRRHLNLVYSIARRCTASEDDAQDVAQAVFVILARKAAGLRARTVLTGWLCETTRYTAACVRRTNARRHAREHAAYLQSTLADNASSATDWHRLAPHLEAALSQLGESDRTLLALRFYENKSGPEVAALLGIREAAAHKRTARALERLRKLFSRRGVVLSAAAITVAVSANAVQAAPAGLAAQISTLAAKGALATISTASLVKGTLQALAWAKFKTVASLGLVTVITGGVLVAVISHAKRHDLKTPAAKPAEMVREVMTQTAFVSLDSPPGGVLVQPDGKIVVAASLSGNYIDPSSGRLGYFQRGAIRLNADGSLDRTFYCPAEFSATDAGRAHVDLLPDGKLLLSGLFDSLAGQPRPGYARLLPDGSVDGSFVPTTGSTNVTSPVLQRTYLPGGTYPAAALRDGSVAVMTTDPPSAFRLDSSGKLIPSATNSAASLFPPHAGLIYTLQGAGFWGNWWGHQPVDWHRTTTARRRPLVKPLGQLPFEDCAEQPSATDAASVFQALFAEVPIALCRDAVPLPEGGAILAIQDEFINGSFLAPGRFMRFHPNWLPDLSFTNQYETDRRGSLTLKRLPDGKFLVAGGFTKMNGEAFPGLVKLLADGQLDPSFHCQVGDPQFGRLIMDLAVQADGRIVICGPFTLVNGVKCQHIARLNPDGSLDATFKHPFLSLAELETHRRFPVYHLAATSAPPATNVMVSPADIVPAETILITSLSYQGGLTRLQFTGLPKKTYILQAKDTLAAAVWINLSTNHTDAAGNGSFRDADAQNHPTRFYRIATP